MLLKNHRYRMPAEWEKHARTFVSWPVQRTLLHPDRYESICEGYRRIIEAISEFEPVTILVNKDDLSNVSALFSNTTLIDWIWIEHDDGWIRDNGPTFVVSDSGEMAGINWEFNGWGEKYPCWRLDNEVPIELLAHYGLPCIDAPIVLEGGAFHVDGQGTLLTTEQCLFSRNPDCDRVELENYLKYYLNVTKIIWLKKGLVGDETDGHVDNIACFAGPGKVLILDCDDPSDPNYNVLRENQRILQHQTDALGRKLTVIPIPQPPKRMVNGVRLPLSYLNFYFVNGGIILPLFGGCAAKTDQWVVDCFRSLFPNHRIRTVDGMAIIHEGGNVHCITQQMPAINIPTCESYPWKV